jgi:Fe-S-cluster containining protein
MGGDLESIYSAIASLGGQPECATCRQCEENVGLVYLLGPEAAHAKSRALPVIRVGESANYFSRTPHGWCPCYDPSTNTCGIYKNRPLCCRLYPIDLVHHEGRPWWVLHGECPIAQRWIQDRHTDVLVALLEQLEELLDPHILRDWISQDRTSSAIESLESDEMFLVPIRLLPSIHTNTLPL